MKGLSKIIPTEHPARMQLHQPSVMVPAPADSVSPYPCPTGQQKQMFINRWVAAESGAPPQSRMRIFPPSSIRTFRKIRLKYKDENMNLLLKNKREHLILYLSFKFHPSSYKLQKTLQEHIQRFSIKNKIPKNYFYILTWKWIKYFESTVSVRW